MIALGVVQDGEGGRDLHIDDGGRRQCPLHESEVPRLLKASHRRPAEQVDRPELVQCPRPPYREAVGLGEGESLAEKDLGGLHIAKALTPTQDLERFARHVGQVQALRGLQRRPG